MRTRAGHFQFRLQFIADNSIPRFVVHLDLALLLEPLLATSKTTLQPIEHLQPFLLASIGFMVQSLFEFFTTFRNRNRLRASHILFTPTHLSLGYDALIPEWLSLSVALQSIGISATNLTLGSIHVLVDAMGFGYAQPIARENLALLI